MSLWTKSYLFVAVILIVVSVGFVVLRKMQRLPMSVSFEGWTNVPPLSAAELKAMHDRYGIRPASTGQQRCGDCARLSLVNNGRRFLRFDLLAVDYRAEGGWTRVLPKNYPWFSGSRCPQGSVIGRQPPSTIDAPRPPEIPTNAVWRILFVTYLDEEMLSTNSPRLVLNRLSAKLLGRRTLAFLRPAQMVSPEIPLMNVGEVTK